MYNFNFMNGEKLIDIFDEVLVIQNDKEKVTTIVLTDKRMLFLDYITNDGLEVLRITKGINFTRYKEVYYEIDLNDVRGLDHDEYYRVILNDGTLFEFNNQKLYKLLKGVKK